MMLRDDTAAARRELADDKAYQANKRAAEIAALDKAQPKEIKER